MQSQQLPPKKAVLHSLSLLMLFVAVVTTIAIPPASADEGRFRCQESEDAIQIFCDDALVLQYNITPPKSPDPKLAIYERSGYIHPIYTPGGKLVTGDLAPDHAHQHGLFVAWTKTTFRGQLVDFWNQKKGLGIVLHDRVIKTESASDHATFQVATKHLQIDSDGNQTPILDDVWTVRLSMADRERPEEGFEIQFSIAQRNITSDPLVIEDYHYGGIGFRGNNDWFSDEMAKALTAYKNKRDEQERLPLSLTRHRFLTSDGLDRIAGNHTRPDWTCLYGIVDDSPVSVTMSGDPDNFRHPHPVRLHPTKPYFSISPCVLGKFQIGPDETYRATYRFVVADQHPLEK